MKAYKGFNADMTCRDFQYKPGGEYEMNGEIKVCKRGFHGCEMPMDVLQYYPPGTNSRYFEVEQDGEIVKSDDNSKIASSKIKIGAEIGLSGLVDAQIEWVKARATAENKDFKQPIASDLDISVVGNEEISSAGHKGVSAAGRGGVSLTDDYSVSSVGEKGVSSVNDQGVASAGWYGASSAGYNGVASAGWHGASSAGCHGVSSVGNQGISWAGYGGVASAGDEGQSSAGRYGVASAGDRGMASADRYGVAASRGSASVGQYGIACARGLNAKVRGDIGALLVIGLEPNDSYALTEWIAFVVDGKEIKADTWYTLENGKLKELIDEQEPEDEDI